MAQQALPTDPPAPIGGGTLTPVETTGDCGCCGQSGSGGLVYIPCCPEGISTRLLAEFVSDCGNFGVILNYSGESAGEHTWAGTGNCSLCPEDFCTESENCWTLVVAYSEMSATCTWNLYNCDALITFGLVSYDCEVTILQNLNPFPCVCAAGTTVTVTAA